MGKLSRWKGGNAKMLLKVLYIFIINNKTVLFLLFKKRGACQPDLPQLASIPLLSPISQLVTIHRHYQKFRLGYVKQSRFIEYKGIWRNASPPSYQFIFYFSIL